MKELFLQYKIIILRTVGAVMLVVGFASYFWTTPKPVLTQNEIAAQNVSRIQARVNGGDTKSTKVKSSSSRIMSELKEKQKKQLRYMVIMMMMFGIGFLGYSFIAKKK